MTAIGKKEASFLFLGDIVVFVLALWLALFVRHLAIPGAEEYLLHLEPFSFLFVLWAMVFYIAGLYEKHTLVFKKRLPVRIFTAQVINSLLSVLFFYLIPYFSITPKTILFLYLIFSFSLLLFWRLYLSERVATRKKQKAILLGSGVEMEELKNEVNNNPRYRFYFTSSIDLAHIDDARFEDDVLQKAKSGKVSMIVLDLKSEKITPLLPKLYNLLFMRVYFFDIYRVYEDIFDRIPISLISYTWFLENISSVTKGSYDILKRLMDVSIALVLGIVSLVFYPFVFLAIKTEDGGQVFLIQERVGKNNLPVRMLKFRTMSFDDRGRWNTGEKNQVTRVGRILRKSRIDELPQLWNVLRGDISLIGPRPEFPEPVARYEKEVPYYGVRHLLSPGLSGWAQIHHEAHPHHTLDVDETKRKLSYDLYYIKNRSFLLDFKIALQTIRTLLSRTGR